jgi:hypothetical protein
MAAHVANAREAAQINFHISQPNPIFACRFGENLM